MTKGRSRTEKKGTRERSFSSLAAPFSYFIALGSNVGDRETTLRKGWDMLSVECGSARLSRLYETRPMYVVDQPLYLNAVGEVSAVFAPREMLVVLQRIERSLGRDRSKEVRMGPRTLDLDILLCGDMLVQSEDLTIPHPRIAERMFVLVPLLELSPALRDPRTGTPLSAALAALQAAAGAAESDGVYLYHPH
jgi:2-amino-4-hydroxy-6-hydroxymethyldihydropteridine diphosphokinase